MGTPAKILSAVLQELLITLSDDWLKEPHLLPYSSVIGGYLHLRYQLQTRQDDLQATSPVEKEAREI